MRFLKNILILMLAHSLNSGSSMQSPRKYSGEEIAGFHKVCRYINGVRVCRWISDDGHPVPPTDIGSGALS